MCEAVALVDKEVLQVFHLLAPVFRETADQPRVQSPVLDLLYLVLVGLVRAGPRKTELLAQLDELVYFVHLDKLLDEPVVQLERLLLVAVLHQQHQLNQHVYPIAVGQLLCDIEQVQHN